MHNIFGHLFSALKEEQNLNYVAGLRGYCKSSLTCLKENLSARAQDKAKSGRQKKNNCETYCL